MGFLFIGVFILLDVLVLTILRPFFSRQIQKVQHTPLVIDLKAAALCYLVLLGGYYFFVERKKLSLAEAFGLGFFVYATFELTSKSLWREWSWSTVVVDSLWGGLLFALTRGISQSISQGITSYTK